MKKLLAVSLVLFFSLSIVRAQHVNFGIKGGSNSSNVQISDGADFNYKSSIHLGGFAHIHVTSHFAVQPELVYSCQGGERGNKN